LKGKILKLLNELGYVPTSESNTELINSTVVQFNCKLSYVKKEHLCLECENALDKKIREAIVNSESEEAKNYDFYFVDSYLCGNIRFIILYFECPECGKVYEVRDYLNLEKAHNKKKRKEKWGKLFKRVRGDV